MDLRLLKEYVRLLTEKIRSQKSASGKKFELPRFKSLEDVNMMNRYAESFLDKLGQGSSRAAYQLTSRYVLKIAINDKGIAQNEAELDVYTNPQTKSITSKIHSADQQHRWVIADVVRPFKNAVDFEKTTGSKWPNFVTTVRTAVKNGKLAQDAPDFIKAVVATVRNNKLGIGDIINVEHWGKTPDGRTVLLDYGFTEDVWSKHYANDKESGVQAKSASPDDATVKPGKHRDDATVKPGKKVASSDKTTRDQPTRSEQPEKKQRNVG